jgi:hypothetical protein
MFGCFNLETNQKKLSVIRWNSGSTAALEVKGKLLIMATPVIDQNYI